MSSYGKFYYVDDRGSSLFDIFPYVGGQVNVSWLDKGVVKAFHLHRKQDDWVICIQGRAVLIIADEDGSRAEKTVISSKGPATTHIPAGYLHGYKALDDGTIILYHCTNKYESGESDEERKPWDFLGKEIWDVENK